MEDGTDTTEVKFDSKSDGILRNQIDSLITGICYGDSFADDPNVNVAPCPRHRLINVYAKLGLAEWARMVLVYMDEPNSIGKVFTKP